MSSAARLDGRLLWVLDYGEYMGSGVERTEETTCIHLRARKCDHWAGGAVSGHGQSEVDKRLRSAIMHHLKARNDVCQYLSRLSTCNKRPRFLVEPVLLL